MSGEIAVMFSVRPNWSRKIAAREKIIEVRKTAPKIPTPYKGYLYCTLSGCNEFFRDDLHGEVAVWNREKWGLRKGHVWAEFICDKDIPLLFSCSDPAALVTHYEVPGTCLSDVEIMEYLGNGKAGHGLHISKLTIYDKPREISEFFKPCIKNGWPWCKDCEYGVKGDEAKALLPGLRYFDIPCGNWLHRPPQSWCYVEERTEG